jgi:hypothetical protein
LLFEGKVRHPIYYEINWSVLKKFIRAFRQFVYPHLSVQNLKYPSFAQEITQAACKVGIASVLALADRLLFEISILLTAAHSHLLPRYFRPKAFLRNAEALVACTKAAHRIYRPRRHIFPTGAKMWRVGLTQPSVMWRCGLQSASAMTVTHTLLIRTLTPRSSSI